MGEEARPGLRRNRARGGAGSAGAHQGVGDEELEARRPKGAAGGELGARSEGEARESARAWSWARRPRRAVDGLLRRAISATRSGRRGGPKVRPTVCARVGARRRRVSRQGQGAVGDVRSAASKELQARCRRPARGSAAGLEHGVDALEGTGSGARGGCVRLLINNGTSPGCRYRTFTVLYYGGRTPLLPPHFLQPL